ncbi:MAG: aminotransferase class I/II-fold pyridoxal phosphate-dependent enzyme [Clostridiales bacterium]|jgi:DNA-binding transcriptional MocR family regulator|nr:aminotransferase class I/II-fold pyridoxal phosphate-dependent enzyme [Clostridiales bacterium]
MSKKYAELSKEELAELLEQERKTFQRFKKDRLSLDMTRGKPAKNQLDICLPMLKIPGADGVDFVQDGQDVRNYGLLDGTPAAKELFAELFDVSPDMVIASDGSSLQLMYKLVQHGMQFGFLGGAPWNKGRVKFICPVPGYDRHFGICKAFGIEMISVPMDENGPDMKVVEALAGSDENVKGIWCVPKYSNPTGVVYSDKVVERLANMKTVAPDFRIFWDNAYMVHGFYDKDDKLKNIFDAAKKENQSRILTFASTSKITFAGAGISALASSKENIAEIKSRMTYETIGPNKLNQFMHTEYLKNKDGVMKIMRKHAEIMRPKFELLISMLEELNELGIGEFTKPRGGYFISLNVLEGCAKRTVALAAEAGVKLTPAGATFPNGLDDCDKNIRIAPSVPPAAELEIATRVLVNAVKIAALEKLVG